MRIGLQQMRPILAMEYPGKYLENSLRKEELELKRRSKREKLKLGVADRSIWRWRYRGKCLGLHQTQWITYHQKKERQWKEFMKRIGKEKNHV